MKKDNFKIALVNPPYRPWNETADALAPLFNSMPALGILALAGKISSEGYDVKVFEGGFQESTRPVIIKKILAYRPDIVGISGYTCSVENAGKIADTLKQKQKGVIIVAGGPHISAVPEQTLSRYEGFDYGVIGEGEETFLELIRAIENDSDPAEIKGLAYRNSHSIYRTPKRTRIQLLDSLPFLNFDLLENKKAFMPPMFAYARFPVLPFVTSRGCPYQCKFCDHSVFGHDYRTFSAEYIIRQIDDMKRKYGVKHIIFYDDLFVIDQKKMQAVCDYFRKSQYKPKLTWTIDLRADLLTDEILREMKSAGCWMINVGLESGAEKLLQQMGKDLSLSRAEQGIALAKKRGIKIKGLFMMGYPGENLDTIKETVRFASRLKLDLISISKFTPYPGTTVYDSYKYEYELHTKWQLMNGMNFLIPIPGMTIAEMDNIYKKTLKALYKKPGQIYRSLKLCGQNPHSLKRLLKGLVHAPKALR